MSDLDIHHLKAGTLMEVGNEGCAVLGLDILNFLIENNFRGETFASVPKLKTECQRQHKYIGEKQQIPCQTIRFEAQRVDDREGNDEEHIVHLTNRHGLCAVSNHAKDGEQTEHEARLDVEYLHQPEQQEHAGREEHKLDIVIATTAETIVDTIDEHPRNEQVKKEHQRHGDEVLAHTEKLGYRVHHIRNTVFCTETGSDTWIVLQKLQRRVG